MTSYINLTNCSITSTNVLIQSRAINRKKEMLFEIFKKTPAAYIGSNAKDALNYAHTEYEYERIANTH